MAAERRRAVELLAPERTGVPLHEVAVNPPPEALGALTGMSWDTDAPEVRVTVHLFADQEQALRVGTALVEMLDGEVYEAQALINGTWLLVVIARRDPPHAAERRARVQQLISAFDGPDRPGDPGGGL
jgi:hypothetical protein